MPVVNSATKRRTFLPQRFSVSSLTCVSFSSVNFIVNVHGKFFKLMVAQLKKKKEEEAAADFHFLLLLLLQKKQSIDQMKKMREILLSYRLQLLLCSFGELGQIQAASD